MDLTEPILSRFDILCVVRDTVDPVQVSIHILTMLIFEFLPVFKEEVFQVMLQKCRRNEKINAGTDGVL